MVIDIHSGDIVAINDQFWAGDWLDISILGRLNNGGAVGRGEGGDF